MRGIKLAIIVSLGVAFSGCNWFTLNCPSHTTGTPLVCTLEGG